MRTRGAHVSAAAGRGAAPCGACRARYAGTPYICVWVVRLPSLGPCPPLYRCTDDAVMTPVVSRFQKTLREAISILLDDPVQANTQTQYRMCAVACAAAMTRCCPETY